MNKGIVATCCALLVTAAIAVCVLVRTAPARADVSFCTAAAVRAAAPARMTIADVPDLKGFPPTSGGVADVPKGYLGKTPDVSPEVCLLTGRVVTNPATGKTANFGALLPLRSNWNHKFMFQGCSSECGQIILWPPVDLLRKGYALWATDDGHVGINMSWAIVTPGVANTDAIVDYAYRAVHTVVTVGKLFTTRYFGAMALQRSYFEGCSDGGREGMVEAMRYPDDFDGLVIGAPYFDVPGKVMMEMTSAAVQVRSPNAAVSPAQFALATKIAVSQCDRADGVRDGLIQNPALCRFNPLTDLPKCTGTISTANCFTTAQAQSISAILAATTDSTGAVIYPGNTPVSDISQAWGVVNAPDNYTGPQPWRDPTKSQLYWSDNDAVLRYWAYQGIPDYNSLKTLGVTYQSGGPGAIQVFHTVVPTATAERLYNELGIASGDFPRGLAAFLRKGHKMLIYHGYADTTITPYITVQYYEKLASLNDSYGGLQDRVRLFMVPGMEHCDRGSGPNNFGQAGVEPVRVDRLHDMTTALEDWVEKQIVPHYLIATKTLKDNPSGPILRTMPLCPFPAMAHYSGHGNILTAASWSCPARDTSMLAKGLDGIQAGLR